MNKAHVIENSARSILENANDLLLVLGGQPVTNDAFGKLNDIRRNARVLLTGRPEWPSNAEGRKTVNGYRQDAIEMIAGLASMVCEGKMETVTDEELHGLLMALEAATQRLKGYITAKTMFDRINSETKGGHNGTQKA